MQYLLTLHFNHCLMIVAKRLEVNKKNHFMELIYLKKKNPLLTFL